LTEERAAHGKIVITGTGRAGTTLLMAMLSDLGCDTGVRPGVKIVDNLGGLERNIETTQARVVKGPGLSTRLRALLTEGKVVVDHLIIPVRDLDVAAASRVRVAGYGRRSFAHGGFIGTRRSSRQRDVLAGMLYEVIHTAAEFDLPHTLLIFPRFAHDWQYLYDKLGWLAPDRTVDDFRAVVEARYDADRIREAPLTRGERTRAALLTPWAIAQQAFGRDQAPPTGPRVKRS
jgi:hypothetical protein